MQPSQEERLVGALAHASILANAVNLAGMLICTVIWATERERSPFVRAHALQALLYQALSVAVTLGLLLLWGFCAGLSLLPAAIRPDLYRTGPPAPFWLALLLGVVPLGFAALTTLYGLYGALQTYHGRPFVYPLAGRVARPTLLPAPAPVAPPLEQPPTPPAVEGASLQAAPAPAPVAPPLEQPPTPPAVEDAPSQPIPAEPAEAIPEPPSESPPAAEAAPPPASEGGERS